MANAARSRASSLKRKLPCGWSSPLGKRVKESDKVVIGFIRAAGRTGWSVLVLERCQSGGPVISRLDLQAFQRLHGGETESPQSAPSCVALWFGAISQKGFSFCLG